MGLTPYQHLEKRFKRVQILRGITHLLRWDAEVMMPPGSAGIRAQQLALLDTESSGILHSKKTAILLDRAESSALSLNDWQQANLREMRRIWLYATAIPKRLINSLHRATTKAEVVWRQANQDDNFRLLTPHLERVVEIVREKAHLLGGKLNCLPYDALLEEHDPGRKSSEIDPVFRQLDVSLPPLIEQVIEKQETRPPQFITEKIPKGKQKDLGKKLMKEMGFPFNKGRLDESLHPFTEGTSEDIRITSLFTEHDFMSGLMGVLHESGHAMYDFGLPAEWYFQPVGRDRGMTVHEGQALFLEMMIGRSREFMNFAAPWICRIFGVSGTAWQPENLFRLATQVKRSFIRMEADEVTYSIHIIIRYELEKEIFAGTLRVGDLPEAWNEKYRQQLGIVPGKPSQGCLQDSHWPVGYFGYFSTYVLGAIMASQLFQTMKGEGGEITGEIGKGNFKPMFDWLDQNVYRFAAKLSVQELEERATGKKLNPEIFLAYLRAKYLGTQAEK